MKLIWLGVIFLTIVKPTHAYLDPGSGSLFFQILIAGLLSSLFFAKKTWKKIIHVLTALFKRQKE